MSSDLDGLDAADHEALVALPSDPWEAVLGSARLQAPDPVLVGLLVADFGMPEPEAEEMIESGHAEIVHHRRAGQLDLIRHAHTVVRSDPGSPPAVSLLKVLLTNHLGWSTVGMDREMRKLMRQLERMTPAERAEVMATAADVEGRA